MDLESENRLLRGALGWRKKKRETTSRFGDSAEKYLGNKLNRMKKNVAVVDALDELLDSQFGEHCKLKSISGGVVRIAVEPGPYMHEMQLASGEILQQIQNYCGSVGIEKIRLFPRKNH